MGQNDGALLDLLEALPAPISDALPLPVKDRMYAIAFDLDTSQLKKLYHPTSYPNAYADIRKVLEGFGLQWQQGCVYFGDPQVVTAVTCVLAAQALSKTFNWLKPCVRDIRMLRIEELNDLKPAL